MGRKPIHEDDLKENLTIRIRKSLIDRLQSIDGYNSLIERLLDKHFEEIDK